MDLAIILVHVYMYLLSQVTIDNYQAFISSSVADNKPKVLIFSSNQHPSLSHLLVAMKKRFFMSVGFVTASKQKNNKLIKDLGITVAKENILLYKEDHEQTFCTTFGEFVFSFLCIFTSVLGNYIFINHINHEIRYRLMRLLNNFNYSIITIIV